MRPMTRALMATLAATIILSTGAFTQSGAGIPKPDLHAGGAHPSLIPNHVTTEVSLPGFHLSGTTVTVDGVCTLQSYKVVSDNEIRMMIAANRTMEDKDDGCFLHIHQGKTMVGTWIIVDLTEAEQKQKDQNQIRANQAKATSYMANLGKQWSLRYSDGATETFTVQPASPGELPEFTGTSGNTAKIAITNDNKVVIMTDNCMLSGMLAAGQVKNGTSMGNCKHSGTWTAQMK